MQKPIEPDKDRDSGVDWNEFFPRDVNSIPCYVSNINNSFGLPVGEAAVNLFRNEKHPDRVRATVKNRYGGEIRIDNVDSRLIDDLGLKRNPRDAFTSPNSRQYDGDDLAFCEAAYHHIKGEEMNLKVRWTDDLDCVRRQIYDELDKMSERMPRQLAEGKFDETIAMDLRATATAIKNRINEIAQAIISAQSPYDERIFSESQRKFRDCLLEKLGLKSTASQDQVFQSLLRKPIDFRCHVGVALSRFYPPFPAALVDMIRRDAADHGKSNVFRDASDFAQRDPDGFEQFVVMDKKV